MRVKYGYVDSGPDQVSVQRLKLKISPSSRKIVIFKIKVGKMSLKYSMFITNTFS